MQDLIFSSIPSEQLKFEISEEVYKKIVPLFQHLNKPEHTELMTRKQVAKFFDISLPTLLDWTNTGKIIGYRIGGRVLYKKSELEQALTQIKAVK